MGLRTSTCSVGWDSVPESTGYWGGGAGPLKEHWAVTVFVNTIGIASGMLRRYMHLNLWSVRWGGIPRLPYVWQHQGCTVILLPPGCCSSPGPDSRASLCSLAILGHPNLDPLTLTRSAEMDRQSFSCCHLPIQKNKCGSSRSQNILSPSGNLVTLY